MIKELEKNIITLSCELRKDSYSEDDKRLINLKLLSLFFKYGEYLLENPNYTIGEAPELFLAKGLTVPLEFITVQEDKILISQGYRDLLEQQKQFKNVKNS